MRPLDSAEVVGQMTVYVRADRVSLVSPNREMKA